MTTTDDLVARLAADPARSGVFLDFDGTLADIVTDPTTSRAVEGVEEVLRALVGRLGVLAVVSGRPASFLAERVSVAGARLLGLYGLQEWRAGEAVAREEAARWAGAVERARGALMEALDEVEGVYIEDKALSVAVHWRNARDPEVTGARIAEEVTSLADSTGLHREPGKLVEELRPPVDWDKGAAVRAVAAEVGAFEVAYAGDDLGDLTAFAAVRDLGGVALAVDHGEESPAELLDAADLVIDGTAGVLAFLRDLRDAIPGSTGVSDPA